jgi:prevent-host-death family protein
MHEAKTRLSQLVAAVESGNETEVIIARNGKPAARIVKIDEKRRGARRLGSARGKWNFDFDAFQALDDDVARLFYGDKYEAMKQEVAETRKRMKLPPP